MLVIISMTVSRSHTIQDAKKTFSNHNGLLRSRQAFDLGIHPRTLYRMRDEGIILQLSRGLYRLAGLPLISNPDLIRVAMKVPNGVLCLISALAFHGLTTQVPHAVHVALKRGAEPPRLDYPPLKIYWFTGTAFSEGIELHSVDHVSVKVYSPEKTIADCFKYRNKLGLDVALEALKRYRERRKMDTASLLFCARACRVENVLRPYLEALL
jgi:predicted transcriptional regulator of viral defense system